MRSMDAITSANQLTSNVSSEEMVDELLSTLLGEVCEKEVEFLPLGEVCEKEVEFLPLPRSQHVDVCETVRLHSPQHVLGGYCERDGGLELLQVECVDQKASGRRVCGVVN